MTKRDLVVAEWQLPDSTMRACWNITRDDRARLVWSNRDFFRILQIYLQYLLSYILKFLIWIHAGNPRVPPRVLAGAIRLYQKCFFYKNFFRTQNSIFDIYSLERWKRIGSWKHWSIFSSFMDAVYSKNRLNFSMDTFSWQNSLKFAL